MMLRIIRPKETSNIAVVAGSKQSKWGQSEQYKMGNSRHFMTKKREYLKDSELATNSKKNIRNLYRGVDEFKKGYQPISYLLKDENGDLLADSNNILNMWKNYYSQLLNVHRVSDDRQIEIHTAEPLITDSSPFEIETAVAKFKHYKSPGSDEILAELIQACGETFQYEMHKPINSIWNKEELPDQRKESVIVPIYKKGNKTDCSNYRGISLLSASNKILSSKLLSRLHSYI
jgi:hypothetical protein